MFLLLRFLHEPAIIDQFRIVDWEQLIAQSRAAGLIGRVGYLIDREGLKVKVPPRVQRHFDSFLKNNARQIEQTFREISEITQFIGKVAQPLVILKGSAYVLASLPCSVGRRFSDIDILVRKQQIPLAEPGLLYNGWGRKEVDDYDDEYYRKWMHEIPPLIHTRRQTVIDMHHNILPPTNRRSPKAEQFRFQTLDLKEIGEIYILADEDLVIHSAAHLFTESEFHNGLRDLSDLDMLTRDFHQKDNDFLNKLLSRAKELGLEHYCLLALLLCSRLLKTPLNAASSQAIKAQLEKDWYHDFRLFCFEAVFVPDTSEFNNWKKAVATFVLYLRGHMHRMPLRLLIPHLLRKTFVSPIVKWNKNRLQKKNESPDNTRLL